MLTPRIDSIQPGSFIVEPSTVISGDLFTQKLMNDEHAAQKAVMMAIETMKRRVKYLGIDDFVSKACQQISSPFSSFGEKFHEFESYGIRILFMHKAVVASGLIELVDYFIDDCGDGGSGNCLALVPAAYIVGSNSPAGIYAQSIEAAGPPRRPSRNVNVNAYLRIAVGRYLLAFVDALGSFVGTPHIRIILNLAITGDRHTSGNGTAYLGGQGGDEPILRALLTITGDRSLSAARRSALADGLCRYAAMGDVAITGDRHTSGNGTAYLGGQGGDEPILRALLTITGDRSLSAARRSALADGLCRYAAMGDVATYDDNQLAILPDRPTGAIGGTSVRKAIILLSAICRRLVRVVVRLLRELGA